MQRVAIHLDKSCIIDIDIEVCVFPQEGLTDNPRSDALLVEGLRRGAKVLGAGLGGRVAVGHMCKRSTMPITDLRALARRIADAGVARV
jgi:cytosine/creatinine deaminase